MRIIKLLLLLAFQQVSAVKKCCDFDSYFKKLNSSYECVKDDNKRVQIFSNKEPTNFIYTNNSTNKEECYDVDGNNVKEFKIIKNRVIEESEIEVNSFPKCCPLDNYYDSKNHSCVYKKGVDTNFITRNFLKIGLPHCKITSDYKLTEDSKNYFDFEYRFKIATLARGTSSKFNAGNSCLDKDEQDNLIMRGCEDDLKICLKKRCLHKCCPDGQSFVDGKRCTNTYVHGLNLNFSPRINKSDDPIAIIHNLTCRMYILSEKVPFYLDQRGVFWAFENKTNSYRKFTVDQKSYCLEHLTLTKSPSSGGYTFFMCYHESEVNVKFLVERSAKLVSCVFIIFTILVYLFVPHMLNLFGKILLSYCSALLLTFALLTYGQFKNDFSDSACSAIGFVTLLMALCGFSWLNVMCFDIRWTFGSRKTFFTANQRRNDHRRMVIYSVYGWGLPLLITLITFIAYHFSEALPHSVRPYVGSYKCLLEDRMENYGFFIYYAIPLSISQLVNLILFIKTISYFLEIKRDINKMNESTALSKKNTRNFKSNKDQLSVIIKLSIIMGISFMFEAVSSLYNFSEHPILKHVEIVFDTFNCLQGVFIFVIFVCKENVLAKLCKMRRERSQKMSMSSSQTGQTSTQLTLTSNNRNNCA